LPAFYIFNFHGSLNHVFGKLEAYPTTFSAVSEGEDDAVTGLPGTTSPSAAG
jgi:hypothetical protein